MKQKLHLIRHGITIGNIKDLYYGVTDIPLLAAGMEQAERNREAGIYPEPDTEEYYTTGFLRTEQTFSIIYGERKHKVIRKLRERDWGEYEMHSHDELMKEADYRAWVDSYGPDKRPPGGESANEMTARLEEGVSKLLAAQLEFIEKHPDAPAESVVICHGGPIALLIANAKGVPDSRFHRWLPEPGRGYTLIYENGKLIGEELI